MLNVFTLENGRLAGRIFQEEVDRLDLPGQQHAGTGPVQQGVQHLQTVGAGHGEIDHTGFCQTVPGSVVGPVPQHHCDHAAKDEKPFAAQTSAQHLAMLSKLAPFAAKHLELDQVIYFLTL